MITQCKRPPSHGILILEHPGKHKPNAPQPTKTVANKPYTQSSATHTTPAKKTRQKKNETTLTKLYTTLKDPSPLNPEAYTLNPI